MVGFCLALSMRGLPLLIPQMLAEPYDEWGVAPATVFDQDDFGVRTTVGSLAWAESGVLYCGTDRGILRYDGERWAWIDGFEENVVSLAIGKDGSIYFSSYDKLGALRPKAEGGFEKQVFDLESAKEDGILGFVVWSAAAEDRTYFASTTGVYVYEQESKILTFVDANTTVTSPVLAGDMLYCLLGKKTLAVLIDGAFAEIGEPEGEEGPEEISSLLAVGEDVRCFLRSSAMVDCVEGAFRYETFRRLSSQLVVDEGFILEGGELVAVDGEEIYEFGSDLLFQRRLDSSITGHGRGLKFVGLNPKGSELWVSLGTRVTKLELDSATTAFEEFHGISGAIESVARLNGVLYVTTKQRLLKGRYGFDNRLREFDTVFFSRNETLKYLGESSWGLWIEIEGELALFDGKRMIEGGELEEYKTDVPYEGPYHLYAREGSGILVHERVSGEWRRKKEIVEVGTMIFHFERGGGNTLWLELGPGALGRMVKRDGRYEVNIYGEEHGLTNEYIGISVVGEKRLFTTRKGILEFDAETRRFAPSRAFSYIRDVVSNPWRLWRDKQGRIWVKTETDVGVIRRDSNGSQIFDTSALDRYHETPPDIRMTEESGASWFESPNGLLQCRAPSNASSDEEVELKVSKAVAMRSGRVIRDDFLGGLARSKEVPVLERNDNSIVVELSSPKFGGQRGMRYQYRLNSDEEWSSFSSSPDIELIGLEPGNYVFEARSLTRAGKMIDPVSVPFQVENPVAGRWVLWLALSALVIGVGTFGYTYLLKRRNTNLAELVANRTAEVEKQKEQLATTLEELKKMQSELMESSRLAGRAEVATSVLHNVGNVLNNIMVSISAVNIKVTQSKAVGLGKAVEVLNQNKENLVDFLSNDIRGNRMIDYLNNLSEVLFAERSFCSEELESAKSHVTHAGSIIANQQRYAKSVDAEEYFSLRELVEAAVRIGIPPRSQEMIVMSIEVDEKIRLNFDQSVMLQMLTNFVKNSVESIADARIEKGRIDIFATVDEEEGFTILTISDNGGGIPEDKVGEIFTMGFTTKAYGHGFGMRAVANHVKSMGGNVSIESDGLGKGGHSDTRFTSHGQRVAAWRSDGEPLVRKLATDSRR